MIESLVSAMIDFAHGFVKILVLVPKVLCFIFFYLFSCKVVDYLIDPFVAGTSAGDPESLSVSNVLVLVIYLCFTLACDCYLKQD